MSDPDVKLALRIHDECNGSDVFGSDICTCRPYLIFGIEEAVKQAQKGGSGVIVYFRKEGRALGEVTKYLVYNARKRGLDKASEYFKRTEDIAGVKDMRFQALMPDILHWLGIQKIDTMRKPIPALHVNNLMLTLPVSMSDMKHDAIVGQGIPIHERVEIPAELIPEDSMVEIGAKIAAGYFSGTQVTDEQLENIRGRGWSKDAPWEDLDVSNSLYSEFDLFTDFSGPALTVSYLHVGCGPDATTASNYYQQIDMAIPQSFFMSLGCSRSLLGVIRTPHHISCMAMVLRRAGCGPLPILAELHMLFFWFARFLKGRDISFGGYSVIWGVHVQ
jgi:GTP cyclohydrolase II